MDSRCIHSSGVRLWNTCTGVLLISVGLLLGITALRGIEVFCLPPGHYGSSLFLNRKESLGADPLWCNWGAGAGGARVWSGGTSSSLPHPEKPHSCVKLHWLQPGAVAKEVVEGWWSCNEDVASPHSPPSLRGSRARVPGALYSSRI